MVESSSENNITTITLRPNRSASWAETRVFVIFLCMSTLAVGVFWALLGAWVILPFSGLEALLIAVIFYRVSLNSYQRQVITLDDAAVRVQTGVYYPKKTWHLQRFSASVLVQQSDKPDDLPDLTLRDRDLKLPLGEFLNGDDRKKVLLLLRDAGLSIKRIQRE